MASYEIGVGLGGISKRIDVTNCDFKFAVGTMPLGLSSRYSGGRLSSLRESSRWSTQSKSFSCKPILTFRLQVEGGKLYNSQGHDTGFDPGVRSVMAHNHENAAAHEQRAEQMIHVKLFAQEGDGQHGAENWKQGNEHGGPARPHRGFRQKQPQTFTGYAFSSSKLVRDVWGSSGTF